MTMSRNRFETVFSGLTAAAKKVYHAVPRQDAWSIGYIIAELQRQGVGTNHKIVAGCLDTLVRNKLVFEPTRGTFRAEPIRENLKDDIPTDDKEIPMTAPALKIAAAPSAVAAQPVSPLDRLGRLAHRVALLSDELNKISDEIGDAAIEIQSQMESNDANTEKLRQLGALLKSLNIAA